MVDMTACWQQALGASSKSKRSMRKTAHTDVGIAAAVARPPRPTVAKARELRDELQLIKLFVVFETIFLPN
jgi:hypothetical protein